MSSLLTARTLNGRSLVLVVAAGAMITSLGLGARSTFGLFLDPVTSSLGTGRGMFGLAIAIQNIIWGLSQPVAGAIADRFGAARVLAAGGVGYGLTLILMSTAQGTGRFYLTAGFMIGLATGAASFAVVLAAVGRMAPPEKAPMALGIVTAMGSVGQFVLIPIVGRLIDTYSWRDTAIVLGLLVMTVALFTPPIRGRAVDQQSVEAPPADADVVPLRHELRRAAHSPSYLMLNAAFFTCGFHVTFIGTHLIAYSADIGAGENAGRTGLMLIGLFNIVGSLAAGYFGSRHTKTRLLSIIYVLRAVIFIGFLFVPATATSVVLFGALTGLVWLSTVPLTGGIVASQFGTTHSGTLFGIVFLAHQVGAFIGAWMGGVVSDRASYTPMWWIAGGLALLAALLHLFIDEGTQPQPPPVGSSRVGVAVAAGATAVVVTGGALAATEPARASDGGAEQAATFICVLHSGR